MENCVADTGYNSGENYAFLEHCQLISYTPPHGIYKGCLDGFTYSKGIIIPFKKVCLDHQTKAKKREYMASKRMCLGCPIRKQCFKKSQEKRIIITYYRKEYERNDSRIKSTLGRKVKAIRQSTVALIFGTLTQFMGLQKINTIGLVQADKMR